MTDAAAITLVRLKEAIDDTSRAVETSIRGHPAITGSKRIKPEPTAAPATANNTQASHVRTKTYEMEDLLDQLKEHIDVIAEQREEITAELSEANKTASIYLAAFYRYIVANGEGLCDNKHECAIRAINKYITDAKYNVTEERVEEALAGQQ